MEEKELEAFLPTSKEISEMDLDDFECWVNKAFLVIPERKIKRDPRSHLRKRISEILDDKSLSDSIKEEAVFNNIKVYYNIINL